MAINLEKVQREAPELVDLVKTSRISLEKNQLANHVARVVLVLDISGSMHSLYRSGKVQELVKRAMALGLQFDDDGKIDVYAFGEKAYTIGEYGLGNYCNCVQDILDRHSLEAGTEYAKALSLVLRNYSDSTQPVYVMFVTDGETSNKDQVRDLVINASSKPLYTQFIGVGEEISPGGKAAKKGFFARLVSTDFTFLSELDQIEGRVVDNAGFFAVKDPSEVSDARLYELLMSEYPQWVKDAHQKGILR